MSTSPASSALTILDCSGMTVTSIPSRCGRPPYHPSKATILNPLARSTPSGTIMNGPHPTGVIPNCSLPISSIARFEIGVNARPGPRLHAAARNGANGALNLTIEGQLIGRGRLDNERELVGVGRGELGVGCPLVGVNEVVGIQRVAVVEGQTRPQFEGVLETVRRHRPTLGKIGDQPEFVVELHQTGEEVGNKLTGDDPEIHLRRVECRNLADPEPEFEGAALLRLLARGTDPARSLAARRTRFERGQATGKPEGAGGGGQFHHRPPRHARTTENTPIDPGHLALSLLG